VVDENAVPSTTTDTAVPAEAIPEMKSPGASLTPDNFTDSPAVKARAKIRFDADAVPPDFTKEIDAVGVPETLVNQTSPKNVTPAGHVYSATSEVVSWVAAICSPGRALVAVFRSDNDSLLLDG
jgi:hypothetical protein